jgi:hypothetical protein
MKEPSGIYHDFWQAAQAAEYQAEAEAVKNIKKAWLQDGQWQASAWYLERKNPDRWGRKERVTLAGDNKAPLHIELDWGENANPKPKDDKNNLAAAPSASATNSTGPDAVQGSGVREAVGQDSVVYNFSASDSSTERRESLVDCAYVRNLRDRKAAAQANHSQDSAGNRDRDPRS